MIKVAYEHEAQGLASSFLRALAGRDDAVLWTLLSRESRGFLEGLFAARSGVPLHDAATSPDHLSEILAPLRDSALAALGGAERVNAFGVSGTRVVDRTTAYVLLLPDFGDERIVAAEDWKPSHLIAFVYESREWLIDVGKTAALSAEAGLPDPLGSAR